MLDTAATEPQCVPNIGPKQRSMRMVSGAINLAVSVAIYAALYRNGAAHAWRLLLFLPLIGAGFGVFQAMDKTCVGLAFRGERNMDPGAQAIADPAELKRVRAQAQVVALKASAFAAALTGLSLLLP